MTSPARATPRFHLESQGPLDPPPARGAVLGNGRFSRVLANSTAPSADGDVGRCKSAIISVGPPPGTPRRDCDAPSGTESPAHLLRRQPARTAADRRLVGAR